MNEMHSFFCCCSSCCMGIFLENTRLAVQGNQFHLTNAVCFGVEALCFYHLTVLDSLPEAVSPRHKEGIHCPLLAAYFDLYYG